jgi:anti-sigma regulatory factor (Ser/Thr protein kinase)
MGKVALSVFADEVFLPTAVAFAEKAALALGLAQAEALKLTLATEEVFLYLCREAASGREVQMSCRGGGYYVEEEFVFKARDFNMRAFNITASATFEGDSTQETGLLIASRTVDRFKFAESEEGLRLTLVKEKAYPSVVEIPVPAAVPLSEYTLRRPHPEELKVFVRMLAEYHDPQTVPERFRSPGKVVDMVACGEYQTAIAADKLAHIGGGIIWRRDNIKLVECYGPYLMNQPEGSSMAAELMEHCVNAIARSGAVGLMDQYPGGQFPAEYFMPLGSLSFPAGDGSRRERMAYYRHLEEDLGNAVWSHPLLQEFLEREYRRTAFAREIRLVDDEGESGSPFSVLSAEFDWHQGSVKLRPIWWGRDAEETLAAHVRTLLGEKLIGIFFEMDLGHPWQTRFTPALFRTGFQPCLMLPYGGKGDLVVFQHTATE